jgi:hypothetical protein
MERDDRVTRGQGPEMTVSSLRRGRFTVPKGQRREMAKPVLAQSLPRLRGRVREGVSQILPLIAI